MAKKQFIPPVKLGQALVLNKYLLHLFGCKDLEELSKDQKDPSLEGIDDEGISKLYYQIRFLLYRSSITEPQLLEYDRHIVKFTKEINQRRQHKVQWKYFQYLSLLFTEIYLDRYFADSKKLLAEINEFLKSRFVTEDGNWKEIAPFEENDLNKLAFWNATGSGKTLLMHINIKQFLYYQQKYHAKKLNRIIVLTPNEGLSRQHLKGLQSSGFVAELFSKQAQNHFFKGQTIEVIDVNKLALTDGDKTVAVESFEGNNLVLVDEGHRGSGGDVWKGYRNTLTKEGFSFEYSATFGQAIAAQSGANRDALLNEYGKSVIFDYSYRYFYEDGYGKDYRIMNMSSWDNEEVFNMYMTAYLLCLYEQMLVYQSTPRIRKDFLIARPLGIFVGDKVTAVRTENKHSVSDVVQILFFIQDFIEHPDEFSLYIKRLLSYEDGIRSTEGYNLFADSFMLCRDGIKEGQEMAYAREVYKQIRQNLFNSTVSNAHLYVEKLSGGENDEIGLRLGDAHHFGVINVGDTDSLMKLCKDKGLNCSTPQFTGKSLFSNIDEESSTISILIGSKKFNEGWSSWRVSVMGLMNVGRSEGSEIIQLFGRGVRLKGYKYSLKRSSKLDAGYQVGQLPKAIREIETLNVFGIRAEYMDAFRKYLEGEGLPSSVNKYEKIQIPTVNLLGSKKLKVVRLKKGYDFTKDVTVYPKDYRKGVLIKLDRLPKVQALESDSAAEAPVVVSQYLGPHHLALLNWNRIYFALEHLKQERGWTNMEIDMAFLKKLMHERLWYELKIQREEMEGNNYALDVARWEDITISLLVGYLERAYKICRGRYEKQHLETVYISEDDPNFFDQYTVEVRKDKEEWIERLRDLAKNFKTSCDMPIFRNWIKSLRFDQHLYYPLLCLNPKNEVGRNVLVDSESNEPLIKVSPIALNEGESKFVEDLRTFYESHQNDLLKDKELYLLRNESRKGIGFFESSNFYPDFILWLIEGGHQYVVFIDPKGIRNLKKRFENEKINLFKELKTEIEPSLKDANITLDSFIISNTKYQEVDDWGSPQDFTDHHVLFQKDSANYIENLFALINFANAL